MKKEKKVRTYQRRTKTGKLVTVKQHTAKYDAAEKAKEMLKKKGAGDELSAKKKTKPVSSAGELGFSQADFKAWYHWDQENDPKNPAALKVEKALKAKMGAKAYRKFFNDMSDSYSPRGHLKAYRECWSCGDKGETKPKTTSKTTKTTPKSSKELRAELSAAQDREAKAASKKARAESKSAKDSAGVSHKEVVAFMKGLGKRKWSWSREENAFVTNRDAQGRPMRGISKMSMESAIKKMQKAQVKAASDRRNREFMEQNFRRYTRLRPKL